MKKLPDDCAVVISATHDNKRINHCVISKSLQHLSKKRMWHFFKNDFQYLYDVECVGCIFTARGVIEWPIRIGDLIVFHEDKLYVELDDILDNFLNGCYSEEISKILKEYKIDELE